MNLKTFEIAQSEELKEKRMKKSKESVWDLLDIIKRTKIHVTEVPGEEIEKGGKAYFIY